MGKSKGKANSLKEITVILGGIVALTFLTVKIRNFVNEIQPKPYIDEIFHIPQAQLYCKNIWTEWNPKISTPPGLYLISYALLKPVEFFNGNFCDVHSLRFVNVIGTLMNFLLSYKIMYKLNHHNSSKSIYAYCTNVVSAINIAIFPPLYFFTFLYYTDVWSTTAVLLMYYEHLSSSKYSKFLAAIFGLISLIIRQSNIFWVGFLLLNSVWSTLVKYGKSKKVQDYKFTMDTLKSLMNHLNLKKSKEKGRMSILHIAGEIISSAYPCLSVCTIFSLFFFLNGGAAMGDKQAHTLVFHPMQNLYFLDFSVFFALPYVAIQAVKMRWGFRNVYTVAFLMGVAAVLSETNKLEHPYLLADNRHIAFYIWKRIFGHGVIRRAVIPTYPIAAIIIFDLLKSVPFMSKVFLTFAIATQLNVIYLFELRYFILPYIMCRLHFQQSKSVWLEFSYFVSINAAMFYLFGTREFSWDSQPNEVNRFIW